MYCNGVKTAANRKPQNQYMNQKRSSLGVYFGYLFLYLNTVGTQKKCVLYNLIDIFIYGI